MKAGMSYSSLTLFLLSLSYRSDSVQIAARVSLFFTQRILIDGSNVVGEDLTDSVSVTLSHHNLLVHARAPPRKM